MEVLRRPVETALRAAIGCRLQDVAVAAGSFTDCLGRDDADPAFAVHLSLMGPPPACQAEKHRKATVAAGGVMVAADPQSSADPVEIARISEACKACASPADIAADVAVPNV